MALRNLICILFLILSPACAQKFIGYDCGSRYLNITTLSLLEVGECEVPNDDVKVDKVYVQLLQINDYTETKVKQCKVVIDRTVYECGMLSKISPMSNGQVKYVHEIAPSDCDEMHCSGTFRMGNKLITGLRVNRTISHPIVLAGVIRDGYCDGVEYSDPYGTWSDAIAQGKIDITLTQQTARVSLDNDRIHFKSGTVCALSEESCVDYEGSQSYWHTLPHDQCGFRIYGVLYEGFAHKMSDSAFGENQTVYQVSSEDVSFAPTAKGRDFICGYTLIKTEHPKLLVLETHKDESFAKFERISINYLDIFSYVNSKFVYVEKHIRTQMKNLYRDAL